MTIETLERRVASPGEGHASDAAAAQDSNAQSGESRQLATRPAIAVPAQRTATSLAYLSPVEQYARVQQGPSAAARFGRLDVRV